MEKSKKGSVFSQKILCAQLHALYDLLQKRKAEILADPDLNPGNDELNNELEQIYHRCRLLQECFEQFCPS
ncbi:MAG: hypothetical protein CVV41_21495 [Candidatus Riflebacteria bacterium HGW-Riflebacteria-1]|jgi:hypothetical protein|nr:MAG: hypothetical protein CVV41_21495 [Candidatus Riflebacteria bacterium HGW-Riflebacteria-1]